MPKIIEHVKDRLLAETARQLGDGGYDAVTIRSIAKGCGVGVGTVYNYFPSKEALIAGHLLEDWDRCVATIQSMSHQAQQPESVLLCIFHSIVL